MKRYLEQIETNIFPRNDRMCALIRAKRDLIDEGFMPKSMQALLDHQDGWRKDHDKWRKEGVPYPFYAPSPFPRLLEKELKAKILQLDERRDALTKP